VPILYIVFKIPCILAAKYRDKEDGGCSFGAARSLVATSYGVSTATVAQFRLLPSLAALQVLYQQCRTQRSERRIARGEMRRRYSRQRRHTRGHTRSRGINAARSTHLRVAADTAALRRRRAFYVVDAAPQPHYQLPPSARRC